VAPIDSIDSADDGAVDMRVASMMRAGVAPPRRPSPRTRRRAVETRAARGVTRGVDAPVVSWLERVVVVPASEASVVRRGV